MRYERPSIVRRERIGSLLADSAPSDKTNDTTGISDVHRKENIHPVAWDGETSEYARPEITGREALEGLLTVSRSDKKNDGAESDVHVKANIRPVSWDGEAVEYTKPVIAGRDALAGLLQAPSDTKKPDVRPPSDVHVKEHIVPVRW